MITKTFLSRNLKNILNLSKKFTSGSRESRIAVGKRRLAKQNEKNKIMEIKMKLREIHAENVEFQHEKKYKTFLDDICAKDKTLENAKDQFPMFKKLYYVPLKEEDKVILSKFDQITQKLINEGGRVQLYNVVTKHNQDNPHDIIEFKYVPMTIEELQNFEYEFQGLVEDDEVYGYVIQEGKVIYDELLNLKQQEMNNMYNLVEIAMKENTAFDLDEDVIDAPFNTNIAIDFKNINDPYYVKVIFVNKVVKNKEHMLEIFHKKYTDLYENMKHYLSTNDKIYLDKIERDLEPTFFYKIKRFIENIKENNLEFFFDKKTSDVKENSYIFHNILVKGVNVNRSLNGQPFDYIYIDNHENEGIRYYMHKFFAGYVQRYLGMEKGITSYVKYKENPNLPYSKSFEIKRQNKQIILRSYFFIKHPYIMQVTNPTPKYYDMPKEEFNSNLGEFVKKIRDNSSIINNEEVNNNILQIKSKEKTYDKSEGKPKEYLKYDENYTYNHLAVFENQLISPHDTYLANHGFEEWLAKHKYDPNNWKMVDVDNFVKGNPFFIDWESELGHDVEKLAQNEDNSINSFTQINQSEFDKLKNEIDSVDKEKILPITKENLSAIISYFSKKLFQIYSNNFDMLKLAFMNGKITENELTSLLEVLNKDYARYDSIIKDLNNNFVETLKIVYKDENLNMKQIFGVYNEGLKEVLKKSEQEKKELVTQEIHVPLDERLIKLKEIYEASLSKYKQTEQNANNNDEKESSADKDQEEKNKSTKKGKKEGKDLASLKKTWPRIEKDPYSDIKKELGDEEFERQLKELTRNPHENEMNISTEKKYEYLFDMKIPTVPSDVKPVEKKNQFLEPLPREKFVTERPFKNKLEEVISRKLKDRMIDNLRKSNFPPNK